MAGKATFLDLNYFLLRSQALRQYRQAVRCVRQAPADVRGAPLLLRSVAGTAHSRVLRHLWTITRLSVCVRAWFGVQRS